MLKKKDLIINIKKLNIYYSIIEHVSLMTVKDSVTMRGEIQGAHTKNLFLKNKKNEFILISCLENTDINLKEISKEFKLGNLSFAKEKWLKDLLGVKPGSVTPFGLLNSNLPIKFIFDKKILNYKLVNFHPLENTSTISLKSEDFIFFMEKNNINIITYDFK